MDLRSLKLNPLLIFEVVFNERDISETAANPHISQPTFSNALARLRERLDDPLFERSAQGMAPTAPAKTVAEPIGQALAVLARGLRGLGDFDFANTEREFVVAVEAAPWGDGASSQLTSMNALALPKRGLSRRFAVPVPHFLSMPVLLQTSDLRCKLLRRRAQLYADHLRVKTHAVPLRDPQFSV